MQAQVPEIKLAAGDAVFTAIYEQGKTFGKHLTFYVYTIKNDERPRRVSLSSFVHKAANNLFVQHGVPAGGYVELDDGRESAYIVTTDRVALPNGEITVLVGEQDYNIGVYETERGVTLLNLYARGHRFSIQSMWSRILQSEINKHNGFECDYSQKGIYATIENDVLKNYMPSWAESNTRKLALEATSISPDAIEKLRLTGTDIPLFRPRRVIDLDPKVGADGTAHAITILHTSMETPPQLNLSFFGERLDQISKVWDRSFNRYKIMFRVVWKGRRLTPRTVHIHHRIPRANEQDVEQALRFFEDQGYEITPEMRRQVEGEADGGLAVVVPHYRSAEFRTGVQYVVPLRLLVPIITHENLHLYKGVISLEHGFDRIQKLYSEITKLTTEVEACLIHAMDNALTAELRPVVRWEKGSVPVEFNYGPMVMSARSPRVLPFEGFQAERLPEKSIYVLSKETGSRITINPASLYGLAKGDVSIPDEATIYRRPEQFKRKLRVGLVHPDFRSNFKIGQTTVANRGPQICQGVLTGKFDLIDPAKRYENPPPGDKLPTKYIPSVLSHMYGFFGYNPDNVEVIGLPVADPSRVDENGSPTGYIKAMQDGMNQKVDLFVAFSPDSPSLEVKNRVHYGTYAFAFQNKIPIIHYRARTWKAGLELYGLSYSLLAHLVKRFDGIVFKVDTGDLWSSIRTGSNENVIANPLCVYVDFGPWDKYKVGLITSTGGDFSKSTCHITVMAEKDEELFDRIDGALKVLIKQNAHDFLLTLRDDYFRAVEIDRMNDVAEESGIPNIAISTVKSGGVAGWKLRQGYRMRDTLRVSPPYGVYMTTPDDSVELFPHDNQLGENMGMWRSIRLKKEQPYPASVRVDKDWVAKLGMVLASTAEYLPFPSRMKYPKFLRAADKLSELIDQNVFSVSASPEEPQSGFYSSFHSGLID